MEAGRLGVAIAVLAGSCARATTPLPPPSPEPAPTTVVVYEDGPIRGVLPDGTEYDVIMEPLTRESVHGVTAGVTIDNDATPVVAEMRFYRTQGQSVGWQSEQVYRIRAEEWTVEIDFSGLDAKVTDWQQTVESALGATTNLGLPVVNLSPPLTWASDQQIPMQVTYETFAVRRGCGDSAVACNTTAAVQVLPLESVSTQASAWPEREIWIESYALRPASDSHYVEPGPLPARSGHDLLWTGTEMIVWGGSQGGRSTHLVEGAAFDPHQNSWRMLAESPLGNDQATRATWTGEEMVVFSAEETVGYDPSSDMWRPLGAGVDPPIEPGLTVWNGSEVVTWAGNALHVLEAASGQWNELPDPGIGEGGRETGVIRLLDGRIYAIGTEETPCVGRVIARWSGTDWQGIPLPGRAASSPEYCGRPNQSAVVGGRLLLWSDETDATLAYDPATDRWAEMSAIPFEPLDRPSGGLNLDDSVLVPRWTDAAIYQPATDRWREVELPGLGSDLSMVWTGTEVLMWDQCCYGPADVDAWRWAPPP